MVHTVSMESYTPLLELKENPPPVGYFLPKGSNIMEEAYKIIREHVRAPVVQAKATKSCITISWQILTINGSLLCQI